MQEGIKQMDQYRGATFIYNVKNGDPEHVAAISKMQQEDPEFDEQLLDTRALKPRTYSIDVQAGAHLSVPAATNRQHDSSSILQKRHPGKVSEVPGRTASRQDAGRTGTLTYHEKLLKEIKFSLDIPGHPIRQIISQFQTLLLA